jgi:hypothetical protein
MPSQAVQAAIDSQAAINSAEVSFEHFTVSLIRGTMDALVASAVSQMKAYADLVSTIESGLASFQKQVNPPDGSGVLAWIKSNLPDVAISTDGQKISIPSSATWTAPSVNALIALFTRATKVAGASSLLKLGSVAVDQTLITGTISAAEFGSPDPTSTPIATVLAAAAPLTSTNTSATIVEAINVVLNDDASLAYSQLNSLIKMGLYRVVVSDGHLLTKATFNLVARDQSQQNSSDVSVSSFAANAHANYGIKVFSAGLTASYSQLNIKVANQSSSASTAITETVMGEVLVNFKGDYFPATNISPQA